MKPYLPDVTLYAFDTANVGLTRGVFDRCLDACDFGDALFVASEPVAGPFRSEHSPSFASSHEMGKFFLQNMPGYIRTAFILSVQYDGFIVNPSAWRAEFLDYDYIGAKWAWHTDGLNVGNSGFCLYSKKLLELWGSIDLNPNLESSDVYLCRELRPRLESEFGIRFAPEAVADLFSYEGSLPRQPSFGFHGLFNMWRHIDDEGMTRVAREIADYTLLGPGYAKIVVQYYLMRKFEPLRAFYARLRGQLSEVEMLRHFSGTFNEAFARELVAVGENLMKDAGASVIGGTPAITLALGTDIKQDNEQIDARGRLFPWER